MSKIIKPFEKDVFQSAKRFQKEPFFLDIDPEKEELEAEIEISTDDNNLAPEEVTEDLQADSKSKAERILADAEDKAKLILDEAESKAQKAIDEAQEQAEGIREDARNQGLEEAEKKTEEQLASSQKLIASLVDQIKDHEAELKKETTPKLSGLVIELAEKIIQKEIETDSSVVFALAEEAIGRILEREKLFIRVNPADGELMKKHKEILIKMFDGVDKIEILEDSGIEQGGCVVETDYVKVDVQPESQLEAARKALMDEMQK